MGRPFRSPSLPRHLEMRPFDRGRPAELPPAPGASPGPEAPLDRA